MKTFLSFTLMFGISILSFSQTWAPVGAKWYYSHKIGMGPELTVVESIGDTMIGGKQCRILKSYMIYSVMFPNGTYRYDTLICPMQYSYYEAGKVYLYDPILVDFLVLYNFNAAAGSIQTVIDAPFPGFCPETTNSSLFQYQVNTVNDTVINGITLTRQYISPTQDADWVYSDPNGMAGDYPIIERIGSLKYLFGVTLYQAMEGSICCLRCYQDSNIFYKATFWPDYRPCDYLTPIYTHMNEMDNFKNNLKISPNPFRDYISVDNQSDNEIRAYELFNSMGLKVNSGVVSESHISIGTDHLSPGFYFLKLKTEHLDFFSKIIKTN
jgi:hypothetical protein